MRPPARRSSGSCGPIVLSPTCTHLGMLSRLFWKLVSEWFSAGAMGRPPLHVRISLFYVASFLVLGIFVPYFPVWLEARGLSRPGDRHRHGRTDAGENRHRPGHDTHRRPDGRPTAGRRGVFACRACGARHHAGRVGVSVPGCSLRSLYRGHDAGNARSWSQSPWKARRAWRSTMGACACGVRWRSWAAASAPAHYWTMLQQKA